MQNNNLFLRRLNEGHLHFLECKFKRQFKPCNHFKVQSLIMSGNNWKPFYELNFSKNSTKTIRLFAFDFHEVFASSTFTS